MFKTLTAFVLILSLVVFIIPSDAFAGEDVFDTTLKGTIYGGIIGTLIGAAAMAFTDKPEEHLAYLAYGAGGGIIAGAAVGVAISARAMVEIKDNKFSLNIPEIKTDIIKDKHDEKAEVVTRVCLLRYNF